MQYPAHENGPPITYKDLDKTTKELPIDVQFDWLAQGRLTLRKAKKTRFYDSGTITKFSQSPKIIFGHPELYRCLLTICPGDKTYQNMSFYEGSGLPGEVQGDSLSVAWPAYPSWFHKGEGGRGRFWSPSTSRTW